MKTKALPLLIGILLIVLFGFTACKSDDDTDNPTDTGHANMLARQGMEQLNNVVLDLQETEPEINDENDLMLEATFNDIKAKFDEALTYDANNPMANLGQAILSIVSINYDDELWSLYDDMNALDHSNKRILNNQFQFLAQAPLRTLTQLDHGKTNPVSMMRMQNYVKTSILPKLDTAVSRLSHAVEMADSTTIQIDTGEELMEVDCGEIYAFRASVYALQAAFNMMVAYNMDMVGQDNTYQWIEDFVNIDAPNVNTDDVKAYHVDGSTLVLERWVDWYDDSYEEAYRDEMMQKVVKYNMDNSTTFSTLAEPARLAAARNALLNAIADIVSGSDYILAETDAQNNDIIKIENIVSFNDEHLPPSDENGPNFVQDWDTINDMCAWFDNFLNGSIQMHENDVDFQINVSAFFGGSLQELRDYVPYYHWNPLTQSWVNEEYDYSYNYYATSYTFNYQGSPVTVNNITNVENRFYRLTCNSGYFTTPTGQEVAEGEEPYLPDYTFNGIFPDMTRAKFLALID